ncbi:MAG: hypothetical protein A2Z88_03940 [Omnitrophica WOR_2 bacterium GWA2_47_8]|nr:MAG: hypothetical protein A2Z88_03940 [Omnitrophica WOR_2 bacterium GWA2_47_8]
MKKREVFWKLWGGFSFLVLFGVVIWGLSDFIPYLRRAYHVPDSDLMWQVILAARLKIWGIIIFCFGALLTTIFAIKRDRTYPSYLKRQQRIYYTPIAFSKEISSLKQSLRRKLKEGGLNYILFGVFICMLSFLLFGLLISTIWYFSILLNRPIEWVDRMYYITHEMSLSFWGHGRGGQTGPGMFLFVIVSFLLFGKSKIKKEK